MKQPIPVMADGFLPGFPILPGVQVVWVWVCIHLACTAVRFATQVDPIRFENLSFGKTQQQWTLSSWFFCCTCRRRKTEKMRFDLMGSYVRSQWQERLGVTLLMDSPRLHNARVNASVCPLNGANEFAAKFQQRGTGMTNIWQYLMLGPCLCGVMQISNISMLIVPLNRLDRVEEIIITDI